MKVLAFAVSAVGFISLFFLFGEIAERDRRLLALEAIKNQCIPLRERDMAVAHLMNGVVECRIVSGKSGERQHTQFTYRM